MQRLDALTVELALAAEVDVGRLGPLDALPLSLPGKALLHLRDHAEDSQHNVAHRSLCRDVLVEHGDESHPLLDLMDDVEHVAGVTPEPVEPGDHEFVADPEESNDGREFSPPVATAALVPSQSG